MKEIQSHKRFKKKGRDRTRAVGTGHLLRMRREGESQKQKTSVKKGTNLYEKNNQIRSFILSLSLSLPLSCISLPLPFTSSLPTSCLSLSTSLTLQVSREIRRKLNRHLPLSWQLWRLLEGKSGLFAAGGRMTNTAVGQRGAFSVSEGRKREGEKLFDSGETFWWGSQRVEKRMTNVDRGESPKTTLKEFK